MLDLRDVSLSYPHRDGEVRAVEGITFSIGSGELVALTGPSGCGKSTILHLAAGILTPTSGTIRLDGNAPNPKRISIGLVPQQYGLLPWKSVRENILLPLTIRHERVEPSELERVTESLAIAELLGRYPHELSGGQRQRVALARVFLYNPVLLLMDEPFAALDLLTAEKSRALFRELWAEKPITTLFVTHNPHEAVELTHRTILMGGSSPGSIIREYDHPSENELRSALIESL